jgi:two-component sensor histidine kinase
MRNKSLLMLCTIFLVTNTYAQEINRRQADSIIHLLNGKRTGIERIDLLLNLAQFHVFKPGERQVDFDSAKKLIDEAAALASQFNSPAANGYLALTESYLLDEKGQKQAAKKLAEKAVSILESTSNKHYLGRACYELSRHYGIRDSHELDTRISLVERAVKCFDQAGTTDQNAYSLEMLGDLYNLHGEPAKALQVLDKALAAYMRTGHSKLQGVYVLLGQSNSHLGDYARSLFYMLKALKTAQSAGDTSMQMCQINLSLGVIYQRIDSKEMSVKYLRDGLEIAKRNQDEEAIYWLSINISAVYNELGQPANALKILDLIPWKISTSADPFTKNNIALCYVKTYTALGQFEKAGNYCDTLLHYAGKYEEVKELEITSYSVAVKYFLSTKQYREARQYLEKNKALHKIRPYGLASIKDKQLWYKLDSAQGNFKSAFDHLNYYKSKMDSVFSLNKIRQLQVLEIEYETTIKEDSIKAKNQDINFLTQKNQLQAANLNQTRILKNITIVGIALVLIIMLLLYRQYLHKQRNNKIITQKNELLQQIVVEKEWLLKEVHHRVKNNLQIIMSLLNSQSKYIDNEAALTAIDDSRRRVHAISLIHQKLYQAGNTASIEMPQYINELISYLKDSFETGSRTVFEQDIDPVSLDVSQAIPLGLIINEAVVNAIKYAFPGEQKGFIKISLKPVGTGELTLKISDNGIGLPLGTEALKTGSLGFSLMQGLTRQLEGTFNTETNRGFHISIRFSVADTHETG